MNENDRGGQPANNHEPSRQARGIPWATIRDRAGVDRAAFPAMEPIYQAGRLRANVPEWLVRCMPYAVTWRSFPGNFVAIMARAVPASPP